MKKLHKALRACAAGTAALLVTACGGSVTDNVMMSYIDYSAAVASGRGYDAVEYVSQGTLDRFEELRRIALYGDDRNSELGIYDEIAIYYLRSEFDAEHLQRLTGRDIMNILITADLIGERGFRGFRAGEVRAESETFATLPLQDTETGANYSLNFIKENGEWVADARSFRQQRDRRLENRIEEFRGDRREVISELLIVHGARDGLTPALTRPMVR